MMQIKNILCLRYLIIISVVIFLSGPVPSVSAEESKKDKGFTCNLRQLVEQSKKNVEKIDYELNKKETGKNKADNEAKAENALQKATELTKAPASKDKIHASEKSSKKDDVQKNRKRGTVINVKK